MTNILSRALPPPSNWQDFERLCFDVFSRIWKTNDAEMHGRIGQPQAGVDVYGTDRVERCFVGVQCKGKDQSYGNPLTARELREEVKKAKSFDPPLGVFILATTAPNDATIQKLARELTHKHTRQGLFEVRVVGWTTLRQQVTDYPDIVKKYFPDFAPVDVVGAIEAGVETTRAFFQERFSSLEATVERGDPGDKLRTRILDLVKLIEEGSIEAGLKALERLRLSESDKATPRNRYLIRANIGFARIMMGDQAAGVLELRAAAAEDPTWPKARAVLASAEMLDGNREAAFAIAKSALADDPDAHQAANVLIATAPDAVKITELETLIPVALQSRMDVLLTLAHRAREEGDGACRRNFVARAAMLFPTDWRVLAAQADLLIEPVFALKGVAFTHAVPAQLAGDLERGIALLREAWAEIKQRDNAVVGDYIAANLLSAFEISGCQAEYDQLLSEAINIAPTFPPLLRRYAQSMTALDDWASAAKALDALPEASLEFSDRLFKIKASAHLGKPREAIAAAKSLELEIGSGRNAEIAATMQIDAAHMAGFIDDVLPELLERWSASIVLRSVAHNFLAEDDPRRASLLSEIKDLAQHISDPADRFHAAEALYAAKQYSAAADMYDGLYARDKDTPALYRAITSLILAGRRRDARELFESLSPALKETLHYADIGVAIYEQSGLLREARGFVETALAHDDSLSRRMRWLNLLERIGDEEDIIRWLDSLDPDQQGAPQDLMRVAITIDRLRGDPVCFRFAYRALRSGYSDPSMHLAYMMSLVFTGKSQKLAFTTRSEVAPDTAVLLAEKGGGRKLVRILETESNPRIESNEIAPNAELGPALLGRKVGDEIEIPSISGAPTIYVISEIRNKYLHAHYRSLEQFEVLFPVQQWFGSFSIDESKGDAKFKPIFDSAKRRSEFIADLGERYREGQLPLMMLSRFSGHSPCDAWEWVVAQSTLGLRACISSQEFANASNLLVANRKAVIDPVTLYGLVRLGIADKVRECFEDLGVVQTTIDLLRRQFEERKIELGKELGTLGWDGQRYQMVKYDDAFTLERIEQAQAALVFAKRLTLVPAVPGVVLTDDMRQLFQDVDPSFLDTIYAAQGGNRLLYCDEYVLRHVAAELSGVDGVWTQIAAIHAARAGLVSGHDYLEIVGKLVSHHYSFTTIDSRSVLHQLKKDNWRLTHALQAFATQIAAPTNDPDSVVRLLADLVFMAWGLKPNRDAYACLFTELVKAQRKAQPTGDVAALFARVRRTVLARLRLIGYRRPLMRRLADSTSLTPVALIVDRVTEFADVAFQAIDETLTEALDDSGLRQS
jgi:tetratricopeptide (TPR) repeat protein